MQGEKLKDEKLVEILYFCGKIYYLLRNLAWIAAIILAIYLIFFGSKCYCMWPTSINVPADIHFPTGTEMVEHEQRKELEELKNNG